MNPAEAAAEQILKGAYDEAQAEACPEGRECAVHFRNSGEYIDEKEQYARLIDYVGEYAVVTDDNPEALNLLALVQAAFAGTLSKHPRFETGVYFVGEGTLGELGDKSVEARRHSYRYQQMHDVWEEVHAVHRSVVSALEAGLIDVSKPVEG
jgi:hypothetical protein